ncbi:MAG: phosphatidate cytidylyltransferase [Methanoculleus sp.]|nr:phosphatidate cytidylyltransferase [Methanoculleus sp.]
MSEAFHQIAHLLIGLIGAGIIPYLDDLEALILLGVVLAARFLACDANTCGYGAPVLSQIPGEPEHTGKTPFKGAIGALFCLAVFGRECTAAGPVTVGNGSTLVELQSGRHLSPDRKPLEGICIGVAAPVTGVVKAFFPLDDGVVIQVGACVTLVIMRVIVPG